MYTRQQADPREPRRPKPQFPISNINQKKTKKQKLVQSNNNRFHKNGDFKAIRRVFAKLKDNMIKKGN